MICAIVLAAGRSTRMGTQKLLLPLNGIPIIARIIETLQSVPLEKIFVVVGSDESVVGALAGKNVELVHNADSSSDMLASVRCGLREIPTECDGVLMVLGDQPGITSQLIAEMLRVFQQGHHGIVVPTCGGRRGHPLLFATRLIPELLTQHDGIGLRGVLHSHRGEIGELPVSVSAALEDIDTLDDYKRHEQRSRAN